MSQGATSTRCLNPSRDGDSTTSLGSLFQRLTALSRNKFFLIFSLFFWPLFSGPSQHPRFPARGRWPRSRGATGRVQAVVLASRRVISRDGRVVRIAGKRKNAQQLCKQLVLRAGLARFPGSSLLSGGLIPGEVAERGCHPCAGSHRQGRCLHIASRFLPR